MKKGMELSINMIVVVILGLTVFGFGIYMVSNFFGAAQEQKASIDRDTEAAIENLLSGGTKVGIPINRQIIQRGDSEVFGLGILNTGGQAGSFQISVSFDQAFRENKQEILTVDPAYVNNRWMLYDPQTTIGNNDFASVPILIQPDARVSSTADTEDGTYIFNVCVCRVESSCNFAAGCSLSSGDLYGGSLKKIYVTVP